MWLPDDLGSGDGDYSDGPQSNLQLIAEGVENEATRVAGTGAVNAAQRFLFASGLFPRYLLKNGTVVRKSWIAKS